MATATAPRDSGKPRYLQIADDLAQQIRAKVLPPGEQVPSESELMDRYAVSQGTVRRLSPSCARRDSSRPITAVGRS